MTSYLINGVHFTWKKFMCLPYSCLLYSLYPCPVKSKLSNHYFMFAYPCSDSGNTKPSNKSRLNKWSRVNTSSVSLNPPNTLHLLTWALLHPMARPHMRPNVMTMWSHDDMPWPCQPSELLQEGCNEQTNKCQEFKSCQPFRVTPSASSCHDCDIVLSVTRGSGPTLTIPN